MTLLPNRELFVSIVRIGIASGAPSLSLRLLQGQGGEFDLASSTHRDQNPRPVANGATRTGHPQVCPRIDSRLKAVNSLLVHNQA
jgi:hypothetical protein